MKTKFIRVECDGCGNEQIVYSHAASKVKCLVCDKALVVTTGGRAKILGKKTNEYG